METAARPTGIAAVSVGGGAWPNIGNDAPNHTSTTCPTGVEGAGESGGHGWASRRGAERSEVAQPRGRPDPTAPGIPAGPSCGARGRRSPAGLRDDAPSEARGADGERAGRSASITTTPQVWRAPEGPEGTGGLRGAATNEVRSPSLAGSRALRRPEHPWGHKQPDPASGRAAAHGHTKQPDPAGARQRLRLARNLACNALAARFAQGQAAVAVDGRTHVDEAWARQERRVGAGAELADGI